MITFEPTEEQRMMRDTVADFVKSKLRPRVREVEAARALPDDLRDGLVELGLGGLATPEAHGGAGVSARTAVLVEEELGFGDAGAAYATPGPGHLAHALVELADEAQRARFFAPFAADPLRVGAVAWSEARPCRERPGFTTVAKRDGDGGSGWTLSGKKSYVLGAGRAATYVVFAQLDEAAGWDGIGAFVVEAGAAGLSIGERYATVGLDAAAFGEITLDGVRVAEADRLQGGNDFRLATLRMFARQSLVAAARAVGIARAAFELARAFADERKAFGKPIGHFQSIAFLLADRLMDVDGARGLVWRAAWTLDTESERATKKTGGPLEVVARCAEAFAEASEVALRCGEDGIQIHGGAGYVRDVIAEKFFRDARQLALLAPSATTSDQLFAALALGAPLDASTVLPTPEIQPIFT